MKLASFIRKTAQSIAPSIVNFLMFSYSAWVSNHFKYEAVREVICVVTQQNTYIHSSVETDNLGGENQKNKKGVSPGFSV